MRNQNFSVKALIISLFFLIPLGLLGYLFTTTQYEQINFNAKEHVGVESFRNFVPIFAGVLKTRNATRATLGGFDGRNNYQLAREQTDQAIRVFEQHLVTSGDPLSLKSEFEKLKAAWISTAQSKNGADSEGRTVFGPVTSSIVSLLNLIGDNSNLVLDPELDSFYLMNTMILAMPQLAEDMGQLWGWGTFALARSELSPKEMRSYSVWAAGVHNGLRQSHSFLQRVLTANPALKSKLDLAVFDDAAKFEELAKDPEQLLHQGNLTPKEFYEKGEAAVLRLQSFYDKGLPVLDELVNDRLYAMKHRLAWMTGLIAILLLLATYFFYSFYLVTKGGLRLISLHLQEMADGDLRKPPSQPWGRDEPAAVIIDLRKAYDSLHTLIQKVRHSAHSLNSASNEIASASMDLSARTEAAAASLEEQAAAMEQIGSTVAATAERANVAATFAVDNAHVAEKGGQVFSEVVETMRDIHTSSSKINDIIGVIDGIAFQTNILALNAAVEAARAGEQGRGFAVVATEVRSLAGRSAEAAREIKGLISESVNKVQAGTHIVEEAGDTMHKVVANASQINSYLGEIATASREQAAGVDQVGKAIQELDRNTQQNAALVEQTTAAAGTLHQQADTLLGEIANFKVA
jgi:methyl-accepting chemotaxis protein